MDFGHNEASHARVLVVDDEPSIRLLCRVNLELDGYEVLEAGSVGEARERLADAVDVVLLDVHLGDETSGVLVRECHAQRPPVPVVLVTGSADVLLERSSSADAVLPKPFDIDVLLSTVRELAPVHVGR
ncbi:MAG TPA: response regulator [Gaiellaceae bacterium]|jgi:DNA-binding response OmpR family regulator|nr:response regulator [Gaiellaceae bacterium]